MLLRWSAVRTTEVPWFFVLWLSVRSLRRGGVRGLDGAFECHGEAEPADEWFGRVSDQKASFQWIRALIQQERDA